MLKLINTPPIISPELRNAKVLNSKNSTYIIQAFGKVMVNNVIGTDSNIGMNNYREGNNGINNGIKDGMLKKTGSLK